jgi:ubiquinone/menaquinone biosynthesis C-methylase UbiE
MTERLERNVILELVGDVEGARVLDVGCGDGDLALGLWQRGARVTGIDAASDMIAAARNRARKRGAAIAFEVGRADHLPFAPAQFDLIVAITILCFVQDAAPVFSEMVRVLRPGGRLVIGELGKWSSWAAMRRIRAWHGSALWASARFRTKVELRRLAEGSGLIIAATRGAIYYPRWSLAAQLLARFDPVLGRLTTAGAAFIALSAIKPGDDRAPATPPR